MRAASMARAMSTRPRVLRSSSSALSRSSASWESCTSLMSVEASARRLTACPWVVCIVPFGSGERMAQREEQGVPVTALRRAALAAVALATLYVLWEIHLPLILRNTTTTFAELGMHLHEPAYLRDHLLDHFQLPGWSPSFFAGAPFGTFYFPLVPVPTLLLSLLLPYNVAFKLATALGLITLPACAYAFGRLHDQDRMTSACLAVATLPFLLLPTTALGGSISSTLSSEYPYAISLAIALLALGVAGKGLRTGGYRALTAG